MDKDINNVNLLICPCGKIPEDVVIVSGDSYKWTFVTGNCCYEWHIEFRTNYNKLDSMECEERAIEAWNQAPRSETPNHESNRCET